MDGRRRRPGEAARRQPARRRARRSATPTGGLVQRSQGKWYPGEPLPRWQIGLIWRPDGTPVWTDPARLADPYDEAQAQRGRAGPGARRWRRPIAVDLGLPADAAARLLRGPAGRAGRRGAPARGPAARARPGRRPTRRSSPRLDADHPASGEPVAWALPVVPAWFGDVWASPAWRTRRGRLVLVPGDSPAGRAAAAQLGGLARPRLRRRAVVRAAPTRTSPPRSAARRPSSSTRSRCRRARRSSSRRATASCTSSCRPDEQLERWLEIVGLVERAAATTGARVVLEGYGPPPDPRITQLLVTPDPGVIEVNLHPTGSWAELSELTHTLYALAAEQRLGTETFAIDGRHSGTGGGNHITLGGATPATSPMLLRPDLLVSMLTWWQRHPSLSYVFSGPLRRPDQPGPPLRRGPGREPVRDGDRVRRDRDVHAAGRGRPRRCPSPVAAACPG